MLFATLDPTSRQVTLRTGQRVVLTDTVGFINKLPHDLVDAFRATLEEVLRADLLLEVVDASDPDFMRQQEAVQTVLDELGAGTKPRITVFNKIDLLEAQLSVAEMPGSDRAVFASATLGEGTDTLRARIAEAVQARMVEVDAVLPYERGELVARARSSGAVRERYLRNGVRIRGHLPDTMAAEITAAARPVAKGRNGARNSRNSQRRASSAG